MDDGELTFAQGDRAERSSVRQGIASTSPPAGPGFIRMSAAGRTEWAAVNLFDASESDLRERPAGPGRGYVRRRLCARPTAGARPAATRAPRPRPGGEREPCAPVG